MTPTPSASQTASADAGEGLTPKDDMWWLNRTGMTPSEIIEGGYLADLAALRQTSSEPVAKLVEDLRHVYSQMTPSGLERMDSDGAAFIIERAIKHITSPAPAAPEHAASERVLDWPEREKDIAWLERQREVGHCGESTSDAIYRGRLDDRIDRLLAALNPQSHETPQASSEAGR